MYWKEGSGTGNGGSRTAGRCGGRKAMGLGHWPLPYSPVCAGFIGVGVRLSESNIIADAVGPERFTCEALLRLLAPAVGGPSSWCIRLRSWASP